MVNLHDIIPPQHRVAIPVNGTDVEVDVRGLNLQDISNLIARHPDVILAFADAKKIDVMAILKQGPLVVGTILAMACGSPNDERAEAALNALPLGTQAEILTHVVKMTAPKGVGPFVTLLKSLGLDLNTVRSAALSKAQSPMPSPTSSEEATTSVN